MNVQMCYGNECPVSGAISPCFLTTDLLLGPTVQQLCLTDSFFLLVTVTLTQLRK